MTTGVGTDVAVSFGIESTPNTRVVPDTSVHILSESFTGHPEQIISKGLGGGRRFDTGKAAGNTTVGASLSMEARTAGMVDLLRLCLGGDPTPSGTDPYTRVFAGGGDLPSSTWQKLVPYSPTLTQAFDYMGMRANGWTLTQNPNEYAKWDVELIGQSFATDQTAVTFAPPAAPGLLSFSGLTVTTPGGPAEFDSVTVTGANALERAFKIGAPATAGQAAVRPNGRRTVTGTLGADFEGMTAFNRYVAGTEGTLTLAYALGTASLTIAMNVFYTGETPTVGGEGTVKQGIPFMALSSVSDAEAITVTLVNDEA